NSSSRDVGSEPGLVDSPPTSMISAPSSTICIAWSMARSREKKLPPSKKESGVTFRMPMMTGLSLNRFLQAIYLSRENLIYLLPVEHFLFEQGRGNGVQCVHVVQDERFCLVEASRDDVFQLLVYLVRRGFAEVSLTLHFLAEEDH